MKCGTSTLFAHLAHHPEIARPRAKEPEFFSEYQPHGLEVERYEDIWDFDRGSYRYCLEASTGYTKFPHEPHVPDRMLEFGIDPKLLYLVRDPVDRMESHFNHGLIRKRPWAYDDILAPQILNVSRYYMQLHQFLLRFPNRDRYRIVDFDELVSRPQKVVDRIVQWLGLEPFEIDVDRHANETPEPSRLEHLFWNVDLSAPLSLVPRPIKHGLKAILREHDPASRTMTGAEKEKARDHLARDIKLFGRHFDYPVEKWGF